MYKRTGKGRGGGGKGGGPEGPAAVSVTVKQWPSVNLEANSHQTPSFQVL